MGDTFNHLGFTMAMLPDMLLGVLTGKTKSIGLNQQTMVPLASLLAGTFASNPLMKFPLMLYGGASLFNTAGQEALAEQRKNQSNATRYKRYDDEPLDKRLDNPQVEGNVLYATFWGYQDPSYDEIKTDNQMTDSNKSSYTVKAWRIYFKDGKEVKREELPESKYDLDNGSGFSADDDLDTDSDDSSNSSGSSGSGSAGTEAQTQTAPASQGEQSGGASQQSSSGDGGGEQSPPQTEAQAAQPENESPQP